MSDCALPGDRWSATRPEYARQPVREYDHSEPIRGAITWSDGRVSKLTFSRYVNGAERVAESVQMDGWEYAPRRACTLTLTFRGNPCNDYTCSACGKIHSAPKIHRFCPRCGAAVIATVVDETGLYEEKDFDWMGD